MKQMSASEIRELVRDIEMELQRLQRLEHSIEEVQFIIEREQTRAHLFYENLALKLHNFYTGCERIFQTIASELNGALPAGYDWHKRLLERMSGKREDRPAVLTTETARRLQEYLGFRHVVRNIYGFELDPQRVAQLVAGYPPVWHQLETEVRAFLDWLMALAEQLEAGG